MHLLTISLVLTLSALCVAQPQGQQRPFAAVHPSNKNNGEYARFDNEQVLRVQISSIEQLKQLEAIVENKNLDLWSNLRIGTVDVRVPLSELEAFKAAIPFPFSVMISNLQDLVPEEAPAATALLQNNLKPWNFTDDSFWLKYHDLATLNTFTETMVNQFPRIVTRTSLGHTHEGREVFGLTIHRYNRDPEADDVDSDDKDDDNELDLEDLIEDLVKEVRTEMRSWWSWLVGFSKSQKKSPKVKTILLHGGQHAREWIGPATVSYIAKELILGYGVNKKITQAVDRYDFTIIPVLNADGYAYTWEHNRMWRKNRQPTSIPFCPGIDTNRNWGYKWNHGGSSGNPCNEAYRGPEAFAAEEPTMIANYILRKKNVVAYLDFHAYSQLWMTPFGGDCSEIPDDDEDIMEGGLGAAKALMDVHGTKFAVGSICKIIYQASGSSVDWTYAEGGVKYSYGVELRDKGLHGYMLPAKEILPSGQETLAAVVHLANFIRVREDQWGDKV
ncbi:Carboxypeptidase A4 [Modicella reniformis]|uniref:Carboxypeptidase M14A n=1 Tax=Modicella reniformis TaxID=1440133 RepID=A0A9P6SMD3_9FUNG|nr:Carboxypeptidase A4 [Modicella reniformis]